MQFLKYLWNWFFGNQKTKSLESSKEVTLRVIHKKELNDIECTFTEVGNDLKENISVTSKKIKKESFRKAVGNKAFANIKTYLIKNGSIDTITCQKEFNIKSLRNFIWVLRKDGLEIKTNKIEVFNDFGQKIKVNNYTLTSKNAIIS